MKKPHKHAALMAEYAKDAAETETPWERWEWRQYGDEVWNDVCAGGIGWHLGCEYRRRPRTITINGIEVPEPLRVAPENGTRYYLVSLGNAETPIVLCHWRDDEFDRYWLQLGLIHLDEESALTHARALLSFTQKNQ